MRFQRRYIILFSFLFSVLFVAGQTGGLYDPILNQSSNNLYGKLTGEIYYLPPRANTNYFIHNDWVKGTVIFKTGEIFSDIDLRYNAFEDELLTFNNNVKVLVKIDKEKVKEFTLNFSRSNPVMPDLLFVNIDSASAIVNTSYFECFYQGSVMLLVSNRIFELKVSPYNDSTGKLRDTEFVQRKAAFIYSKVNGLTKIRFSNRSLAKVYPENKHEILKLLRHNKIRISDTQSASTAFQKLDQAGLLN